jgi:thioredoxin-related protein
MKKLLPAFLLIFLVIQIAGAGEDDGKSEGKKKSGDTSTVDTARIIWYPYDVGLKMAEEKNKHILVNFTAKWCGYCKKMNKTTFKNPDVVRMLNNDFVSVKVDGDSKNELNIGGYKITERNLTKAEYRVMGYPAYWFLKPNGDRLGVLPGYQDQKIFLEVLYFMKEALYEKMKFEEYMKNGGREAMEKG